MALNYVGLLADPGLALAFELMHSAPWNKPADISQNFNL